MSKIEEAKQILEAMGLPKRQQNDRSALTLLALCNLKEKDKWKTMMGTSARATEAAAATYVLREAGRMRSRR